MIQTSLSHSPDLEAGARGEVAVPLADLRREPCDTAERVNQALLGTPLKVLDRASGPDHQAWLQVRLPDYEGWMHAKQISPSHPPGPETRWIMVAAPRASLRLIGDDGAPGEATVAAYMGTRLRLAADAAASGMEGVVIVLLPGDREALANPADLAPAEPDYRGGPAAILASAQGFLGTPYLWGGMTCEGIDCSGLAQIAYRVHGYTLPRDADEQFHRLPDAVAEGAWQPGDLIFFGPDTDEITHVVLYTGAEHVIHASGAARRVLVQSLNPAHADYHRRPDRYLGARRVIPAGGSDVA